MKKLTLIGFFAEWIKSRLKVITLLAVCCISLIAVSLLGDFFNGNFIYALVICAFFVLCFGIYDFAYTYVSYKKLYEIHCNITTFSGQVEAYGGVLGEGYAGIVSALSENLVNLSSEMKSRDTEAMDYYTLWTHQIKTPIAAMKLIIENGNIDEALLKSELFRIERYTEMALSYIRLESINEDMILREYNIHDIAASAMKKYFILFSLKKLSLDFEEFSLMAVTDEKWLTFVIEQLISNFIKYTADGGISIRADGSSLVISDTGIGISSEDLPRIFERGFTGFNGRMDKKSTGLGLYLCRKILAVLGHKITISSEKGKGTTVIIDFTQERAM